MTRRYMQCAGGHVGEVVDRTLNGWVCGSCGLMNHEYSTHACQFVGFWHEHLGHKPVYVDSWKTYRQQLKRLGANNVLAS